eukprot:3297465-Pyramimonas_sp.AAC.1
MALTHTSMFRDEKMDVSGAFLIKDCGVGTVAVIISNGAEVVKSVSGSKRDRDRDRKRKNLKTNPNQCEP